MSVGVINPARKSVRARVACAVGKVCTCKQLNDSVQLRRISSEWLKKENTSVAVLISLNSIQCQLNPRILSNTTKEARSQGTGGARTKNWAPEERDRQVP